VPAIEATLTIAHFFFVFLVLSLKIGKKYLLKKATE
jgi:hypothetical protein